MERTAPVAGVHLGTDLYNDQDQTWNWVAGSMGHLGHLSRPGHRVIILTRCETPVFPGLRKNAQNAKRTFEMLK